MNIEEHYRQFSKDFLSALYDAAGHRTHVSASLDSLAKSADEVREEADMINLYANAFLMGAEIHNDN